MVVFLGRRSPEVRQGVGNGASEDGEVGQGDGVLRLELLGRLRWSTTDNYEISTKPEIELLRYWFILNSADVDGEI